MSESKDIDFSPIHERKRSTELCSIWYDVELCVEKWEDDWGCTRQEVIEALTYTLLNLTSRRMNDRVFQHPKKQRDYLEYIQSHTVKYLQPILDDIGLELAEQKYGNDLLGLRDSKNFGWEGINDDDEIDANGKGFLQKPITNEELQTILNKKE